MAKLQSSAKAGFNAAKKEDIKMFSIEDIKIDPEIAGIFTISDKVLKEIQEKIQKFGYSEEEPVVIWKGKNILVDGRTRYTASMNAGLNKIPVFEKEFKSRDEAILYTFERQAMRRNITGAEILAAAKMIKGDRNEYGAGRKAKALANKLGVSQAYIYQAKAVLKDAPAEDIKAIKKGKKTIKKAYEELKERQKPESEFSATDAHALGLPESAKFLRAAVTVLAKSKMTAAAGLLINHFLKNKQREGFRQLLPENIRLQLENSEDSTG